VNPRVAAAAVAVAAALGFCYRDVFALLVTQWMTIDTYSHGFLIPPLSLGLVYTRRDRLRRIPIAPSYVFGSAGLAAGLALLVMGRLSGVVSLQEVSLLVTLGGLVLLILGWQGLRLLAVPIAYLILMMPVLDIVTERLHQPFQLMSARVGAAILRATGHPVFVDGILVHLPSITLQVAEVCSGVNYLLAVFALGIPLAIMSFPDTTRRLLLVVGAATIAILSNALRVAVIGFLLARGWAGDVHGPGHVLQGMSVAAVGYVALFVGTWLLGKWDRGASLARPAPAAAPAAPARRGWLPVAIACLGLVAGGVATPRLLAGGARVALSPPPAEIGSWRRIDAAVPQWSRTLGDEPSADAWHAYQSAAGERVQVYLAPYVSRTTGSGARFWTDIFDPWSRTTTLDVAGRSVELNQGEYREAGVSVSVLYWYDLGGRVAHERFAAKLAAARSAVWPGAEAPVVIIVAVPQALEPSRERALAGARAFAREAWAHLPGRPRPRPDAAR
jgi:EpsI family protein